MLDLNKINNHLKPIFEIFSGIDIMISGGSILSILNDEPITDYDIFFRNENDYKKCYELLCNDSEYENIFNGLNGNKFEHKNKTYTFDLVFSLYFDNKTNLTNHFDFTICQIAVDKYGIEYSNNFEDDFKNKKLQLNNIPVPGSTLKRLAKYIKKGYTIHNDELEKLYVAIQNTTLQFPKLEESNLKQEDINEIDYIFDLPW
jgi:hypothetical protein